MNKLLCEKKLNRLIFLIVIIFCGAVVLTDAATFTVTRADDRNEVCASGVDCSLREAVSAASAAAGDDVIEFSPNLTLVTLTTEIKIQVPSGSITINGRGANVFTIDGGAGTNRIFSTIFANVTLTRMTLTGGNGRGENRDGFGGAIQSDGGSLTLDALHVTGNTTSSAGGGVIFENGTYRIMNSTFSSNTAFNCGGISNGGAQLTIVNSTVSGNTVSQQGGGLCANGNTTLRQVTITNNAASNAGGILKAATGTLNFGNTIVAANGANEITFNAGAITSAGNNIVGDTPGDAANTGSMPVTYHSSDILDTPPRLNTLHNNGGPTPTHALLPGSPALDKGNNSLAVDPSNGSALATDQRGFERQRDGNGDGTVTVDVGAFEVRAVFVTNVGDGGSGSLRQALADAATSGDAVIFSPSVFNSPQIITLTGGELVIPQNANFTINGTGSDQLTISGNNQSRVFFVAGGARVAIGGVKITGGSGVGTGNNGTGGGIYINTGASVTLTDSIITGNTSSSTFGGGGIFNLGILTINNSFVSNNSALINGNNVSGGGGGINNFDATLTINDSTINDNSTTTSGSNARGAGGGIYNISGTVTINASTVRQNAASRDSSSNRSGGGGIANGGFFGGPNGIVNLVNSTVNNNTTNHGGGGGINNNLGGILNLTNSTISANSATGDTGSGGGIYNAEVVNMIHATVANNTASQSSGGILSGPTGSALNSRNSIVADNTAPSMPDFSGTLTSQGYNLIENTNGTIITGTTNGNILGQDPQLLPLGNYGGSTQTHALRPYSPAVDKGNNSGITTDQRGRIRPYNNPNIPNAPGSDGSDIGAFERQMADFTPETMFDYDGDGRADISVFRPSSGSWYISNSSNNQFVAVQFGAAGDLIAPADFDGDGKTDINVFRPSDGGWYRLNSSNNTFSPAQFGTNGDLPAPGDFDGDGKADLTVFRPSSGSWYRINSSTNQFVAAQFGADGDKPLVADFDGDGKSDLAVFRPSDGGWYRINSATDTFSPARFGTAEDKPVPADYDGDGKADLAVYRPSVGDWYIINSSNSAFQATHFGVAEDKPAPADFDGDGKADLVVFRPSNGTWYLLRTTTGFTGIQFGAAGDIPTPNAFVR